MVSKLSVLIAGANSQDQDVFVFNAPQTGLSKAKDSVAVMKGKSRAISDESVTTNPPGQPTENAFNFVSEVNHTAQATTQTTKKQRYKMCILME